MEGARRATGGHQGWQGKEAAAKGKWVTKGESFLVLGGGGDGGECAGGERRVAMRALKNSEKVGRREGKESKCQLCSWGF